ncbi:amino acid permease [Pseudomonas sp. NPDC008258]|uniref:APC family permease n=1 Tax=Pseudomonas sp. NPDC008258 TaxID=3364418 RepID=UPI0036E7284E
MSNPTSEITSSPHPTLKRQFKMQDALTLAFVYISPIVALYAIFGLIVQAAGPAGWWVFPVGLGVQLLIALSLGVLVSRWPLQGGSYQWARRLAGNNYGWITGWFYIWTLIIVFASNGYAIATFIPAALGIDPFSTTQNVMIAIGILAIATGLNLVGPTTLKLLGKMSLAAEVIGSVVLATVLLIWHRVQDFDVIFTTAGTGGDNYLFNGLLMALGFMGFGLAGFESVCSMAEEIEDPERNLPKAIIGALIGIGVVVSYSALALILATPDFGAIISGAIADPAAGTIQAALGDNVAKLFFVLVIIGFAASMMMAQTSVSRVIWAFSNDKVLPCSGFLSKLSSRHGTPDRAILVVGLLSILVTLLSSSERVYATLISSAGGGFFITMAFVVLGLAVHLISKKWKFGPFRLGWATIPVVLGACAWIVLEIANIVWPRAIGEQAWYVSWAVFIALSVIGALGLVVWLSVRGHIRNAKYHMELPDPSLHHL